jgi:hypothetical protein
MLPWPAAKRVNLGGVSDGKVTVLDLGSTETLGALLVHLACEQSLADMFPGMLQRVL